MTLRVNKTFYFAVVIILAISGSLFFVFFPNQKKGTELLKTLNEKRVDLTLVKEQVQKIGTGDNTNELTLVENKLDSYFIDKKDILQFISVLEDIAQKHTIEITIILDEFQDNNTGPVIEQPISLEVVGEYANMISFLSELEAMDYYLSFQNISLSTAAGSASVKNAPPAQPTQTDQTLKLTLSGISYWRQ